MSDEERPMGERPDETDTEPEANPAVSGRVLDAAALRALAHPLRFQLVELLIEHGPSTASKLGRLIDESSGLTSYHLRELAKHELIEEAPELGSARDRYWQPVRGGYTLEGFEMLQQDATREDAQYLLDEVVRSRVERLQRWHREGPQWGRKWTNATAEMTARMRLTHEELAEMTAELVAIIDRFREQQAGRHMPDADVTGAVPVTVQIEAFPTGDPPTPSEDD